MSNQDYRKELESLLPIVLKTLEKNYVDNPVFICGDGRYVRLTYADTSSQDIAKEAKHLLNLFISCDNIIIYTNPVNLIQLNVFYLGCYAGVESDIFAENLVALLRYIMPQPDLLVPTYNGVMNAVGKLASPKLTLLDVRDPLEQVMKYSRYYFNNRIQNVINENLKFVCFKIYDVYLTSFTSSGLAYCTTFDNLAKQNRDTIRTATSEFSVLWNHTANKVTSYIARQKSREICRDINNVLSLIGDEVKEANKLMEKYGIIRVTFPLS